MKRREPRLPVSKPAPSRRRRWLRALGRFTLVVAFVGLCVGGWAWHAARAQVTSGLSDLGHNMMAFADAHAQDAPRDLVINGQILRFTSGTTARGASEVLDYYEGRCQAVDGQLREQLTTLAETYPGADIEPTDHPSLREEDGRRGYVACLDMGEGEVPFAELVERLRRYGQTGDVSAIGELRFVMAEEREQPGELRDPEPQRTHFVAMWTEGTFDVDAMFPEDGDAPGDDVPGLARPDGARRVLTGYERGVPYRMTVYQTPSDEVQLERFYRGALREGGFTVLEPNDRVPARALVAERGDRMLTVLFHEDPETRRASAAVFDSR